MYFLLRNAGDSRWQMHLSNIKNFRKMGNLITVQSYCCFFCCWFFFFLTYWTIKSPDLGTTELDALKCLIAVKPLALQSITNNIFALRLLAGMRTWSKTTYGRVAIQGGRIWERSAGACGQKRATALRGTWMDQIEREVLRSRNQTCPLWLSYHLEVEITWDYLA